jgi:hypothetical protein
MSMTMGPWIHVLQILVVDQTDLSLGILLVEEVLPRIVDVVGGRGGTRCGRAAPRWHRPALTYGHAASCQVHLLVHFIFVTFLAYFIHIFCLQKFSSTSGTR